MRHENLVLANELIKAKLLRFGELTLLAFAFRQSEYRNCGLLLVFVRMWKSFAIGGNMVTLICE